MNLTQKRSGSWNIAALEHVLLEDVDALLRLEYPLCNNGREGKALLPKNINMLHGGNRANVFKVDLEGRLYCVKVFYDRRFRAQVRNRLGFSKARRAFRNGIKLLEKEIPAPRPFALAVCRLSGIQLLISELVGDGETVRTAVYNGASPEPLLKKCTIFTRMLAEQGVFHKDYGARNVLLDGDRLLLIDWEDIRFTASHIDKLHQKLRREFLWRLKRDGINEDGFLL